jgi:hypothetical protein
MNLLQLIIVHVVIKTINTVEEIKDIIKNLLSAVVSQKPIIIVFQHSKFW